MEENSGHKETTKSTPAKRLKTNEYEDISGQVLKQITDLKQDLDVGIKSFVGKVDKLNERMDTKFKECEEAIINKVSTEIKGKIL